MRQNIDEKWKTDPRRTALANRLGSGRLADGMRVEINWLVLAHKGQPIPLKEFKFVENYQDWIDCELAEVRGGLVHIAGADAYQAFFSKQVKNGGKGGRPKTQKNPKQTQTKPEKPSSSISSSSSGSFSPSFSDSTSDSGSKEVPAAPAAAAPPPDKVLQVSIWDSYSRAYFSRYKTEPVRNAKVNAQIKQLAKRLGKEAIDVVEFYVRHPKAFYVAKCHDIGLCVSDAEALRTQWARGSAITGTEARHSDTAGAIRSQLERIDRGEL
jgi:hypothetical protein